MSNYIFLHYFLKSFFMCKKFLIFFVLNTFFAFIVNILNGFKIRLRIYFLNKYSSFLIGNVIIMNIFIMVFFNVVIIFTFIFMKYLLIVDKYKTLPNSRARNM